MGNASQFSLSNIIITHHLDGRRYLRVLEADGKKTFTQNELFTIVKARIPAHETIMGVKDHDKAIQSGFYLLGVVDAKLRTGQYGVYPRGFEKDLNKEVGDKIIWIEEREGRIKVDFTFEVPDVSHPSIKGIGLRQATGMLVFNFEKLKYDENTRTVSVDSGFDPKIDVVVKDVMRSGDWALVDDEGFPLRSKPSRRDVPEARRISIRKYNEFKQGATGWHGSIVRDISNYCLKWIINACDKWSSDSGVLLIERMR